MTSEGVVIGQKYRAQDGSEFVPTREVAGHVFGVLSGPGKPSQEGAFRWGVFTDSFKPVPDDGEVGRDG